MTNQLFKVFVALFFSLSIPVMAQQPGGRGGFDPSKMPKIGKITGTLVDSETQEPLVFAAIKVTSKLSEDLVTGGMSNEKGQFLVEGIALGPSTLEFAFVGYKTLTQEIRLGRDGIEKDLGIISLISSGIELEEVTVEAEGQFMTNEIDRKVYDPSKLILSKTGSASDILENIPSIELDIEGNITLRGSNAVRIMIDGRPSRFTGEDLSTLLQALPGNSIDKVEVMTNPSAKYDPDGTAGMINIVLKKSALQGLNGSFNTSWSGADRVRAGANFNFKNDNINYFFNAGHSSGRYPRTNWSSRVSQLMDGMYTTYQEAEGFSGRNGNNIKAGIDWTPSTKHTFTLQGTINQGIRPRFEDNSLDWTTPFDTYTIVQLSEENGTSWNNSVDAIYDWKPSKEEFLNVRMSYTDGMRDDRMDFEQDTLGVFGGKTPSMRYNTHSYGDQWEFNGLVDYTKKWGESTRLESGVKVIMRDDLDGFERFNTNSSESSNNF